MRRATAFAALVVVLLALGGVAALALGVPWGSGTGSASPSGPLTCSVKGICDTGEVEVFRMSSLANAHAGAPAPSPTPKVCCALPGLGTDCGATNHTVLFTLSATDNAHVAADGTYATEVCLSEGEDGTVGHLYTPLDCPVGMACVATISGESNAHVADCDGVDDYLVRVCAEATPDNCPGVSNPGQEDFDGDDIGDVCDPDNDNDGIDNVAEGQCGNDEDDDGDGRVNDGCPPVGVGESGDQCTNAVDDDGDNWINDGCPGFTELNACGSKTFDPASIPERLSGPHAGQDDDGDTEIDEGLPSPGSDAYDCDGDGFTGTTEMYIFSEPDTWNDQAPCAETSDPNDEPDDVWPVDFNDDQRAAMQDVIFAFVTTLAPYGGLNVPVDPGVLERVDFNENGFINMQDVIYGYVTKLAPTGLNTVCTP